MEIETLHVVCKCDLDLCALCKFRQFLSLCRFLQGPEMPEHQLYREPPPAFLEADYLEVGIPPTCRVSHVCDMLCVASFHIQAHFLFSVLRECVYSCLLPPNLPQQLLVVWLEDLEQSYMHVFRILNFKYLPGFFFV